MCCSTLSIYTNVSRKILQPQCVDNHNDKLITCRSINLDTRQRCTQWTATFEATLGPV